MVAGSTEASFLSGVLVDMEGTSTRASFLNLPEVVMDAIARHLDMGESSIIDTSFGSLAAVQETVKMISSPSNFLGAVKGTGVTLSRVNFLGSILKSSASQVGLLKGSIGETSKLEPSFELVGDIEEEPAFQMPGYIKETLTGSIAGVSISELSPAKSFGDAEKPSKRGVSFEILGSVVKIETEGSLSFEVSNINGTIVKVSTGACCQYVVLGSLSNPSTGELFSFKILGEVDDAELGEPVFPDQPSDMKEPPKQVLQLAKPPVGLLEEGSESGRGIEDGERARVCSGRESCFSIGWRTTLFDMLGSVIRSPMVVVPCKLVFECQDGG